ncbi:MAG: hypothetical protein QXR26_08855 [Candidatus Caldarchaeum sp.]
MRVFKFQSDEWSKCGGYCSEVQNLYNILADSEAEAKKLLESGDAGLCGDCLSEMLAECG